ncbi:MAG: biotin/lipoyl-containing protein, partial [Pseudolysinimonas sp.]
MPREFLLPDLGEGLTEAEIVAWLVQPGDIIAVDQPVVEVESAKSTVELPSPFGGRVEKLHAAAGEVVHKGGVLITVAEAAADVVPGTALRAEPMDAGSGAVLVGYGTKESTLRLTRPAGGRFGSRQQPAPERRSPVVSPLVRRRALDHGIDATQLTGTGPGSLVVRRDVDAAIAAQDATAPSPAAAGDQRIPITGMR